jgi:purine-binding chemotaxis protein CheW
VAAWSEPSAASPKAKRLELWLSHPRDVAKESSVSQPASGLTDHPSVRALTLHAVTNEIITFIVDDVSYGLLVTEVREVHAWAGATPMIGTADYVRGIINLRGAIIPIIDLRARFSRGLTDAGEEHVIVIVVVDESRFGLLVDGVSEIIHVSRSSIKPVPPGAGYNQDDLILGIVSNGDHILALLDAKRVVRM